MRFVVTGGGTAGHIYPALALAQALLADGHQVAFAGTPDGLEARLIPQSDERISYVAFTAHGFVRRRPWTLLTSTFGISRSAAKARKWLKDFQPAAIAGFGGYVSIPVGLAAQKLKIPLLIHEQNSAAGMANRYLARRAQAVGLTYALDLAPQLGKLQRITGNPVRAELLKFRDPAARDAARAQFRAEFGIPADALVLLVFGGSQGARHINQAICALAPKLLQRPDLHIIHITGPKQLEDVEKTLAASAIASTQGDVGDDSHRRGDRTRSPGSFEVEHTHDRDDADERELRTHDRDYEVERGGSAAQTYSSQDNNGDELDGRLRNSPQNLPAQPLRRSKAGGRSSAQTDSLLPTAHGQNREFCPAVCADEFATPPELTVCKTHDFDQRDVGDIRGLSRYHLIGYCDRMGEAFSAADCLVARSGATSLAEITALGLPSLLVPYPYATDDHQRTNAKALVDAQAALMVLDSDLDTPQFADTLNQLLDNRDLRITMAQQAAHLGTKDAVAELKNLLYTIAVTQEN